MTTTPLAPTVESRVVTPRFASWGRRVVAALLDGAVLSAITWFAAGEGATAPSLQPTFDSGGPADTVPWTSSAVLAGAWLAMLVLQGLTGQTPGRRVVGIEVVHAPSDGPVGGPPGVLRSVLRWFAHLLDAFLLVGYLRPLWHAERRTFADSLADTVVVHRAPAPREDGRSRAVTAAAWLVVAVGLAAGVTLTESGGMDRQARTACPLEARDPGVPVRVMGAELVREVEWRHPVRLWTWVAGTERTEREELQLEVHWDVPGPADHERPVVVRATTGGAVMEHQGLVGDFGASVPIEARSSGTVQVDVLLDGRTLMSCTAPLPPRSADAPAG
ncbi:RDD family protein [Cellulomonas phragmiteti]|uniref:RDD domain-containing protein n=1 Tax=Cellulomonas phragmiteti TaxID=478780 RepID=A0ABQ4DP40_9CELL|nr:RDD family protein [Cellulomonas phragmiteti]GIG41112.1 hypothetical protein Cph01nite_28740 [Cellulomonas phragmiteti]